MNTSSPAIFAENFVQNASPAEMEGAFNSDLGLWVDEGGAPLANWFTNVIHWIHDVVNIIKEITHPRAPHPHPRWNPDSGVSSCSTTTTTATVTVTSTTMGTSAGTSTTSYSTNC